MKEDLVVAVVVFGCFGTLADWHLYFELFLFESVGTNGHLVVLDLLLPDLLFLILLVNVFPTVSDHVFLEFD